jgi:acetyl-CoA carboxylase carboxyl transferase subunit beta
MIRYGDTDHARAMATQQRVRASDLLADGIADEIIDERPTADADSADFCRRIGEALTRHLNDLQLNSESRRMSARIDRYAKIGHNSAQ